MSQRAVNLLLLIAVPVELLSGLAGFFAGTPGGRWVFWVHAVTGFTLLALLPWKAAFAFRSLARRGLGGWTILSALLSTLFLASLATGVLWATVGIPDIPVPFYASVTGLTLHMAISLAVLPFFLVHVAVRWFPPQPEGAAGRRQALRSLATVAAGAVVWQTSEGLSSLASLSGARRRFTGSREQDSFAGNQHPVTNWLFDKTQHIGERQWRLRVHGLVDRDLSLTYDDLLASEADTQQGVLDCTSGWYTVQDWQGPRLSTLLLDAGVSEEARSLVVRSATGYSRRFSVEQADQLMLALRVGGEPLAAKHGYPARLVAPGWRGYNWVKWVESIEVSGRPPWLQPPLPLQ